MWKEVGFGTVKGPKFSNSPLLSKSKRVRVKVEWTTMRSIGSICNNTVKYVSIRSILEIFWDTSPPFMKYWQPEQLNCSHFVTNTRIVCSGEGRRYNETRLKGTNYKTSRGDWNEVVFRTKGTKCSPSICGWSRWAGMSAKRLHKASVSNLVYPAKIFIHLASMLIVLSRLSKLFFFCTSFGLFALIWCVLV